MRSLHDRLDKLRAKPRTATPIRRKNGPDDIARSAAEVLGGRESHVGNCPFWEIETELPARAGALIHTASVPRMYVDIETGGFSGTPIFLIGVLLEDDFGRRIVQWLGRDYPEEEGILQAFVAASVRFPRWLSFNGRSFDEPFIRDRLTRFGLVFRPPVQHTDLLHLARRRWRQTLPDCRLATLEAEILGRPRVGDVAGSDIPDLFHHFVRTGNAAPLRPVLEHNRLDLIASADLFDGFLHDDGASAC